ncbi:MAG: FTR1 family protein [Candidatus Obscuribacterales bacterium]|nr:FTR1 family protein [Candidatus Obscuribacterales bacterium]
MNSQRFQPNEVFRTFCCIVLGAGAVALLAVLVWQGFTSAGTPDPTLPHLGTGAAVVDTAVLVFREGLETILVLAVVMAGFTGQRGALKKPVVIGAVAALAATVVTWFVAVGILSDMAKNVSALALQAGTGLLAVVVLIVVMNWFLHKFYWTGWLSMHGKFKRDLITENTATNLSSSLSGRLFVGMALLGFSSVYREGFEVVLFLQSLRLQVGSEIVLQGVALGLFFTGIIGVLTFQAHKRLPHRQMLIATGVLLFVVLLVMVGEEAQEMQQAGWLTTTNLDWRIPGWLGVWFSVFPTVETIVAQVIATVIVLGSYFGGQYLMVWRKNKFA